MSNEITAYFKGRSGVAESVYQYDYGKILVIDGLDLPSIFEVHFANSGEDTSIMVIGQNNRVAIPDNCIEKTGTVTAYIYLHSGDNDGETEYLIKFGVIRRAKPDYDEEEKKSWERAASKALAMLQNARKVNTPVDEYSQVYNGIPGQVLRTKGNGATEWVFEEMPTDEQTARAVAEWLDEHPEATTTVQDGSITGEKLSYQLRKKVFPEPINVLTLGVKNDGSEDISTIVNEATQSHSLYFPAGIYRIDTPLNIVNSIYGCGYNRRFYDDITFTTFVSNIDTDTNDVSVINVVGQGSNSDMHTCINVCNIFIKLYSDENGIKIATSDKEDIFIKEVNVCNIGNAYGIWVNPISETSRVVFVDNCTLYGSYEYVASVGIVVDLNAWDCRITNTEIMGTQKGLWQKTSIVYMSNTHIWCGCRSNADNDDWWANTVCIDCSNDIDASVILVGTNVYLDSAYHYIETWRGNALSFNNLIAWMDGSMSGSSAYDGYLVATRGDIIDKAVYIDGLVANFGNRCKYIFSEASNIENAKILYTANDTFESLTNLRHFPLTTFCNIDRFRFIDYSPVGSYYEVARCVIGQEGSIKFNISSYGADIDVYARGTGGGVYVSEDWRSGGDLYYRFSDGILYIYATRSTSGDASYYQLSILEAKSSSGLLIYPYIRAFQRDVRASADGLTKISNNRSDVYSFCSVTAADIANMVSNLKIKVPALISLDGTASAKLTRNEESAIGKGYVMKVADNVVDYFVMIGLGCYIIRTNASGEPSSVLKVNTTAR